MRALFLTWDGPQQTYLESLFLPTFAGLRRHGIEVHVMQFSWASADQLSATRSAAAALGVPYVSHRTSRRFGAAGNLAAIARGALLATSYAKAAGIDLLFPRSLLPAGMALLAKLRLPDTGIVFDADGLMADERVDFGGWNPRGAQYRSLRAIEAATLRQAASVITRTAIAKGILLERAGAGIDAEKIFVIPNAKDAAAFTPGTDSSRAAVRQRFGVPADAPWLIYVGSLGPQYCPEAMLDLFDQISRRAPATRFQLFTLHEQLVRSLLAKRGDPANVQVDRAKPAEIADVTSAADLGLALRQVSFSQRAVCPIKVAEYLQCGVPLVSTGVGDLAAQLDSSVAHMLEGVSQAQLAAAADWFVGQVLPDRAGFRARCRALGEGLFGLDRCIEAYRSAFEYAAGGSV